MRKLGFIVVVAGIFATAGCSLLLDRTPQCKTDDDCSKYGGHPLCQQGVCVPSGLGPDGCYYGTPQSQSDYLNACTTSQNVAYDNCSRLGMCAPSTPMPATTDPQNPTIPPLVNPATVPTANCKDIAGANIVYIYGTSDFGPTLKAIQPLLSKNTPPYRAVFLGSSSCNGVVSIFDSTKRVIMNPAAGPSAVYAYFFDDNGNQTSCLLDSTGNTVDIGVSNLYAQTCSTSTATYMPGAGVSDYTGPVVPFVLSVPAASTQQTISAEAGHMAFGLGGKSGQIQGYKDALPWTDPTFFAIRNSGSGSTVLSSLLFEVPKTKFWGVDRLSTDNLRDSLLASTSPEQSLGILSIDYADKNRGNLRSLFLQSKGQTSGYLPDSNKNVFDKLNVRDGHYPLWGYQHFFTQVGAGGVPSDAAKAFVTRISVSRLDQTLLDNLISASLVPQCAMKVQRSAEMGDFAAYPGLQCGCYFDYKTTGKTDCTPCASASDCPGNRNACNYGFCELN